MMDFKMIYRKSRKKNWKQYVLLTCCNFFSMLLITTFASVISSPTILEILPKGGDSRKQMMMIFTLALVGCATFTAYAATLFFRYKSRETGILLALGAAKKQIGRNLLMELSSISAGCGILGFLCGIPFAFGLWSCFRLIVDSDDMIFRFSWDVVFYAGGFLILVVCLLLFLSVQFMRRTNIIDIVNEQRKSEMIRDVKRWYGAAGFILVLLGGVGGMQAPNIYQTLFHRFSSPFITLFYLPFFPGIYLLLLYFVIRGGRSKDYKNIISHSMMKFQGRQTVRNMLVITLLLIGAYFALFYSPMANASNKLSLQNRKYDFFYTYRQDTDMIPREQVEKIAGKYEINIKEWKECSAAMLAFDGMGDNVSEDNVISAEYEELLMEGNVLSESDYENITGHRTEILPGTYRAVLTPEKTKNHYTSVEITRFTNIETEAVLKVAFGGYLYDQLLGRRVYYVINDLDYKEITMDISDQWREHLVFFLTDEKDSSYQFSRELYDGIVSASREDCAVGILYSYLEKLKADREGEAYYGDSASFTKLSLKEKDTSVFKNMWKYMPRFQSLDKKDFLINYAVFLMLFVFISIICFATVFVIAYTRSLTIALNNRQVYEDLKRLGADHSYLYASVKSQLSKIIRIPVMLGTISICVLYTVILYVNDGLISGNEWLCMRDCLIMTVVISIIFFGFYRLTLKRVTRMLEI